MEWLGDIDHVVDAHIPPQPTPFANLPLSLKQYEEDIPPPAVMKIDEPQFGLPPVIPEHEPTPEHMFLDRFAPPPPPPTQVRSRKRIQ